MTLLILAYLGGVLTILLTVQHRMHDDIGRHVSRCFYEARGFPAIETADHLEAELRALDPPLYAYAASGGRLRWVEGDKWD